VLGAPHTSYGKREATAVTMQAEGEVAATMQQAKAAVATPVEEVKVVESSTGSNHCTGSKCT